MILVSACLAGMNCRFDGSSKTCDKIIDLVRSGEAIPVCPELLGGLNTPRPQTEIRGDRIVSTNGEDLTENFVFGAQEALKIAKEKGCRHAILKSKSPSCGSGLIFDGTFRDKLKRGDGILAKMLKENGITVINEETFKMHS